MPTWIMDPDNVSLEPGVGRQKSVVSLRTFAASCLTSRQDTIPFEKRLHELVIWEKDNTIWTQITKVHVIMPSSKSLSSTLMGQKSAGPAPPGVEGTFYRISEPEVSIVNSMDFFLNLTRTAG
jgi:hypothetical protein